MADNVSWTAGSGTTIATDDVAGVHYQRVKLVDGTLDGTGAIGGDATNGLDVDVTRVIPGTTATALGKAEDAAHTSGDTGVAVLGVRRSDSTSLTALAGSDDDYSVLTTDNRGVLQVVSRPRAVNSKIASGGLTTASTAYSIGDQVGTMFAHTGAAIVTGGTGIVQSIVLVDEGDVSTDFRLHFFRSNVTLASDNAAFAVSDADMRDHLGYVNLTVVDVGANRVGALLGVGLGYDTGAGTTLYVAVETRTANTFFAATSNLSMRLHLLLD